MVLELLLHPLPAPRPVARIALHSTLRLPPPCGQGHPRAGGVPLGCRAGAEPDGTQDRTPSVGELAPLPLLPKGHAANDSSSFRLPAQETRTALPCLNAFPPRPGGVDQLTVTYLRYSGSLHLQSHAAAVAVELRRIEALDLGNSALVLAAQLHPCARFEHVGSFRKILDEEMTRSVAS